MIEIRNVSSGNRAAFKTKFGGASGRPIYFNLGPKDVVRIGKMNLHQYHDAVKQQIADLVSIGVLELREIDSAHHYIDQGNTLAYSNDYFVNVPAELQEARGIAGAIEFAAQFNKHADSAAIINHNVATATIAAATPTNTATLITWFTAGNGATARYNAHLANAAAHPHIDTVNTVATVPATLAACMTALEEIYRAYDFHRQHWTYPAGSVQLSIPAILTY